MPLRRAFGARSALARACRTALAEALPGADDRAGYYALVLKLLAARALGHGQCALRDLAEGTPFRRVPGFLSDDPLPLSGLSGAAADRLAGLVREIGQALAGHDLPGLAGRDILKPLYEDLFPARVRHALGEHYTPDWLAAHLLRVMDYPGPPARLLDPCCGSGTFLLQALSRAPERPALELLSCVAGFDVSPLAVLAARTNLLLWLAARLPAPPAVELPVYRLDAILDREQAAGRCGRVDFVAGNPPWLSWEHLPARYREARLWAPYGLFSLPAREARHGGGKKDLAMLMLHTCADAYLKEGGRLGFVITQTVFQSRGAGDGFRRFRLGDGAPLSVLRVDDLVALRPFSATNWSATLVIEKGRKTVYPVPYVRWSPGQKTEACLAEPIDPDRPTSPWIVHRPGEAARLRPGRAAYTAHAGAYSGGRNGVFWVEILGRQGERVLIRNLSLAGKEPVPETVCAVEPDLLYPLLRWGDVARFSARPSAHLLLPQDVGTRRGIDEAVLQARHPGTYAYLRTFRDLLLARAAYRRYQPGTPFYSMYDVGPYTLALHKVVWRRMDRALRPAVVGAIDDPHLGPRPVVPQETCVFIATATAGEAHYLCALLASRQIGALVSAHSVRGGKGFGTPGMLAHLPLPAFCPDDPRHLHLAALSQQAHQARRDGDDAGLLEIERQIDEAADEVLEGG